MASLDFEQEKALFREYYSENQQTLIDAEGLFRSLVSALLSNSQDILAPTVTSRIKDREGAIKKFTIKYQTDLEAAKIPYQINDHITDLIGVRVICLYEDEVEKISGILETNFEVLETTNKIKALESTEGDFGYKGLHMDLKINAQRRTLPEYRPYGDLRFEVQIRTIVQDAWSVLDHKIKYKKSIPATLKRRINALAAQFETVDHEFLAIKNESVKLEQVSVSIPIASEKQNTPLDVFQFMATVNKSFPNYEFLSESADSFTKELLTRDSELTLSKLSNAIEKYKQKIDSYKVQSPYPMNPYTYIRHVLYVADKQKFGLLLFDRQRHNFDDWHSQVKTQ